MAMGNYCYIQGIECPYATSCGQCKDDIYDDFGICEMLGDDMPPKELSEVDRRRWVYQHKKTSLEGVRYGI